MKICNCSVLSQVRAKMYLKLPSARAVCLYVSGFWHIHGKTPREILPAEYLRKYRLTRVYKEGLSFDEHR